MREDEDQFRYYVPLLRRIIILVAVITAIPVILWTITAFVRTYVAPPKVPTFRPMTATASIAVPPVPDTIGKPPAQGAMAQPPSAMPEARAAANDARDTAPGAKGALLADRMADVTGNAGAPRVAELTPAAPADATPRAADGVTPGAPNASAPGGPAMSAQMPTPPMDAAADTLPAAAPLSGPVPLPRHRPRNLDVAQLNVPVPRPRPGPAGEGGSDTSGANPLEWIRSIFQPQPSQQQSEQQ
jgi:hypothetical protein